MLGRVLIQAKQGRKRDCAGKKVSSDLLVEGANASELVESIEETLDKIAFEAESEVAFEASNDIPTNPVTQRVRHHADFVATYNFARRLKTLNGLILASSSAATDGQSSQNDSDESGSSKCRD
jgi:hypothetical protein